MDFNPLPPFLQTVSVYIYIYTYIYICIHIRVLRIVFSVLTTQPEVSYLSSPNCPWCVYFSMMTGRWPAGPLLHDRPAGLLLHHGDWPAVTGCPAAPK